MLTNRKTGTKPGAKTGTKPEAKPGKNRNFCRNEIRRGAKKLFLPFSLEGTEPKLNQNFYQQAEPKLDRKKLYRSGLIFRTKVKTENRNEIISVCRNTALK